jgi:nucleotide-binding universal stress UspA family protein
MIRDLVVNLAAGKSRDSAAEFAISLAAAFEAHVTGVSFAYEPVITPTVMDGLSAAWIDTEREQNRSAAQAAIDRFAAGARNAGVSYVDRLLAGTLDDAARVLGTFARSFDLAVLGQADPDRGAQDDLMIEAALFNSGRPVVIVPYIHKGALALSRVLVCWDASRSAARAVADAMPFLRRGQAIEVVVVGADGDNKPELPGVDLGEHLARHGLNVEVKRLVAESLAVADVILSHAADCGADFIVMGGYGHSRLREFVLGGVTRTMLAEMTVPVLMSH